MQQITWLALGYNAPAEPSKNRVYVWRKLKECGAGYFRPGVAILPGSQGSMAHFCALAEKIREMGGEAVIVELKFCDARDEAETIARFKKTSENEYREFMRFGRGAISRGDGDLIRKLAKQYKKVKSRDYFSSRDGVSQALVDLADDMERVTAGLGRQLLHMLDL